MSDSGNPVMAPTAERMVPQSSGITTFWEHIYRYHFASQFVKGKTVLDVASGEGYGSASLLAAGAAKLIGIDISEEAVNHARNKYNIDVRLGNGEAIPINDNEVDIVVSFETIEHLTSPQKFIEECVRVLKIGGTIVLSTPLLETYGADNNNEHHVSEMSESESIALFNKYFKNVKVYAQRPHSIQSWNANIAADDSIVVQVRKFWSNFLARAVIKSGRLKLFWNPERFRERPIDAIAAPTGLLYPFNPYRITPRNRFGSLGPHYLILVGNK
ncbi:MAG: class I SAM-dependent methyltransferase [Pirellula sp.]|jgi:ubiquinone/menaquinone biosynthesis C-methylase UbiE